MSDVSLHFISILCEIYNIRKDVESVVRVKSCENPFVLFDPRNIIRHYPSSLIFNTLLLCMKCNTGNLSSLMNIRCHGDADGSIALGFEKFFLEDISYEHEL